MLRVLFFGRLQDVAGTAEIAFKRSFETLPDLRMTLAGDNTLLGEALAAPHVRVAIDHCFAENSAKISNAAEIAFMSPLSGG